MRVDIRGVGAGVAAVAVPTGAIFGLRNVAPVLSLGVLYTLAVLPIAIRWGLDYAIPVAFASILAFNYFFLPPVYTLELQDSGAWVALCVNVMVAIVVSVLARSLEHSRADVAESRARIVVASDLARRKIERDLHDTTQQRLVSVALKLRLAQAGVPDELVEVRAELREVGERLEQAVTGLREISHGIHPAILSEGGLEPALRALARRSTIPVELDVRAPDRQPERVEVAAYAIVSEALTNAAKHGEATLVSVVARIRRGVLELTIRDDGIGGADARNGTGLVGLRDRVEAIGGRMDVRSPVGGGTTLTVRLPVAE